MTGNMETHPSTTPCVSDIGSCVLMDNRFIHSDPSMRLWVLSGPRQLNPRRTYVERCSAFCSTPVWLKLECQQALGETCVVVDGGKERDSAEHMGSSG